VVDEQWLLSGKPCLIGAVHLMPLPGSPRWGGSMRQVEQRALEDAQAFAEGGADAILVENFGDVPFRKGRVEPWVVAAMTVVVRSLMSGVPVPLGVSVLRNDARAALGVCAATGATFVRVNVLCGAAVTDQGLLEGEADELMRARRVLCARVTVMADFRVKHAAPLVTRDVAHEVREFVDRGLADALVVTGRATGVPPNIKQVEEVAMAAGETPVLVGSGVNPQVLATVLPRIRGVIAATWVKADGRVDPDRVRRLARLLQGDC
jgi:membrane complex biogenesis BtpA family protein